jgi:DNA polymerase-1
VADYGQLELRIMAHMTKCTTMIEALEAGGDFHSRTAMDMYDNVKEACDKGEVTGPNP